MTIGKIRECMMPALAMLLIGATATLNAQSHQTLVVTATNAAENQLLVYSANGALLQTLSTEGKGGASGNAGGVEAKNGLVAAVNFGSQSVSLFERREGGLQLTQVIPTVSSPLSVAIGEDHIYILGTKTIESHQMYGHEVSSHTDGFQTLLKADGSAAQVGVLPGQLIITEKSNVIETVGLADGAVATLPSLVNNIPSNVNAPFGLVTRGDKAYVTIAHANEISLVRHDEVLTVSGSGSQSAPCWVTLAGPFLFSSNSPSKSVSRYIVFADSIVQDLAVAASLNGNPTDIASGAGLIAVIDGNGTASHLSIFKVDFEGNLKLEIAKTMGAAANGVAVVEEND